MTTGKTAPYFNKKDVYGHQINPKQYKEDSDYILLVFLRYSGCPWCNLAIHRLALEQANLSKHRCQVIAFIQSDEDSVKDNIYGRHKLKPLFPIIADKEMEVYKAYGVNLSVTGTLKLIKDMPQWLSAVYKYGFKNKAIDGNLFVVPGWFLINTQNNKIVRQEKGVSFYEHETFVNIYDSLTFRD